MEKPIFKSAFLKSGCVMEVTRRNFMAWGIGGALVSRFTPAQAQDPKDALPAQAKLVRDFAIASGEKNFAIVIKNDPQLIVFENGNEIFRTKIFVGKDPGDEPSPDQLTTPAGIFRPEVWEVTKSSNPLTRAESIMPFYCNNGPCNKNINGLDPYSIHPTLQTPAEQQALQSKNPLARHLSNGCIRVPLDSYNKFVEFMRRHPEAKPQLLILPNTEAYTRLYFGIPQDFSPNP